MFLYRQNLSVSWFWLIGWFWLFFIDFHWFSLIFIDFHWFLLICAISVGRQCVLAWKARRKKWGHKKKLQIKISWPRKPLKINENQWKSIKINENQWKTVKISQNQPNLENHENEWVCLYRNVGVQEFSGNFGKIFFSDKNETDLFLEHWAKSTGGVVSGGCKTVEINENQGFCSKVYTFSMIFMLKKKQNYIQMLYKNYIDWFLYIIII